MKNVVLQHNGVFVAGFSHKLQRVYMTKEPKSAKRFAAVEAQKFISDHADKNQGLSIRNITIHVLKRGMPFDPFKQGEAA